MGIVGQRGRGVHGRDFPCRDFPRSAPASASDGTQPEPVRESSLRSLIGRSGDIALLHLKQAGGHDWQAQLNDGQDAPPNR